MNQEMGNIVYALTEIEEDHITPRNIKKVLVDVAKILKNNGDEEATRVSKAIAELTEITEDQNMESFTRTEILRILSMLEMV